MIYKAGTNINQKPNLRSTPSCCMKILRLQEFGVFYFLNIFHTVKDASSVKNTLAGEWGCNRVTHVSIYHCENAIRCAQSLRWSTCTRCSKYRCISFTVTIIQTLKWKTRTACNTVRVLKFGVLCISFGEWISFSGVCVRSWIMHACSLKCICFR